MALEEAVQKRVAYKFYSSGGISDPRAASLPGTSGGQILRNALSSLSFRRDTLEPREKRPSLQRFDYRLGTKRLNGSITGDLSPGTYFDFVEALSRGTRTAGITKTNTEFTSIGGTNASSKFTVGASTWAAQGFRAGDMIRLASVAAANTDVNYLITSLSTVDAFVYPPPTDMAADSSFSVFTPGKKLLIPLTGFVQRLLAVEHYYPTGDFDELFLEMRAISGKFGFQAGGVNTVELGFSGRDKITHSAGSSPYFTAPTAVTNTGVTAAVNGLVRIGSTNIGVISGLNLSFDLAAKSDPAVGSLLVPEIFLGKATIGGDFTMWLQDLTLDAAFLAETELNFGLFFESGAAAPFDFVKFWMHRVKLSEHTIGDAEDGGIPVTGRFEALEQVSATGVDAGTISVQDTQAS
jgi:hypothetical protein